jgi:large subunit ribosomal protein L21
LCPYQESESAVYAIVRSGGGQQKVAVGDVIEIDQLGPKAGDSVSLPVVLVVDGETVTTDADALARVDVQAEVVGPTKGPKIHILKFKNKTGYRRRQGHRQHYTQVKVTAITTN